MKNTKSGALEPEHLDWAPLFQAFAEAFEWALDQAADFARSYPEEVAAVERVRTFMRKHVAGQPAHVRFDDVLFVFGLLMGVIERDRSRSKVTPMVRMGTIRRQPARSRPSVVSSDEPATMCSRTRRVVATDVPSSRASLRS